MSQENEAVEAEKGSQLDLDSTFDISPERIDNDKNVAGRKETVNEQIRVIEINASDIGNKQLIDRITKKQRPAVYFGQKAIDKLITLGVLKFGQKTCQNPYKTSEEKLWVNNGNGGGDWVDATRVKCDRFLFWQIGNDLPQCSNCNPWNEKYDESEITAWYQTKERNTDGSQPHPFTIAEKYYEDTKNNLQGDKSV
ncbi:MAG TPA: hypothetical protein VE090_05590 [Methylomirabilota bacterium]|nr:hypothetical protein [Methylomirabilota bacterium]